MYKVFPITDRPKTFSIIEEKTIKVDLWSDAEIESLKRQGVWAEDLDKVNVQTRREFKTVGYSKGKVLAKEVPGGQVLGVG